MARYVLSVLVRNSSGVLTRVSGLFSRRGKFGNFKNDNCIKWGIRRIRAIYKAIK